MKIDLFDIKEFIKLNNIPEVTSPILFQKGDIPHPDGLLSDEIFGVTTKSRKTTYAYIDLHGHFFHPHVYKAIRRMFRNVDKIVNGELYVTLNENGNIVHDDQYGETGIEFLYNNWEKINWEKKSETDGISMRDERVNLIKNFKKNEVFMEYQIVIPAFYRDIRTGSSGGETEDINNLYSKLIRLSSMIKDQGLFDFQFHSTNYGIQSLIIDIYDYFKQKIEKKKGLIRKYLMGKNVDYCTRTVITASAMHADSPDDLFVNFKYTAVPISQLCSLIKPFIVKYVKEFFEREIFKTQNGQNVYDPATDTIIKVVSIKDPESYFNERYINNMLNTYVKDPESRFTRIEVPTNSRKKYYLAFAGKRMDSSSTTELASIVNRPMTWTDLLYMACEECVKDKHVEITRYPLLDEFGVFFSRIRVASTTNHVPMMVNGYLYKYYPVIDLSLSPDKIGSLFNDSCQFSNAYLDGMKGDYDGDQTTVKIIYTQEANKECEDVINKKSYYINSSESNIRTIGKEALQTFFVLTKDPYGIERTITDEEKKEILSIPAKDITFSLLVKWLGNTISIEDGVKNKNTGKSKFNPTDVLTLKPNEYPIYKGTTPIKTTVGRLIYTRIMIERLHFEHILDYVNTCLVAGEFKKLEAKITSALKDDLITPSQMAEYIDTRDWLGLQLHAVITTSFTPKILKLPDNVKALRKKLLKENEEAIKNGDTRIYEQIEKKLIAATMEELKDDIGMDLFVSGARGSVGNHLKNIMLTRGAIKNNITNQYDIIEHSLMDGLEKKDIPSHFNAIVAGSYPKACGTAFSGYLSKELLAIGQSEVLGPKDSDCGTKKTIEILLTDKNKKDFMYRYIIDNGKIVLLDTDSISKYVGKKIKLRSPMYCIGVKVNGNKCICNKCSGDFFYKMEKPNIGLACSRVAESTKQMGLQKFHENLVKIHHIDVNDMLL